MKQTTISQLIAMTLLSVAVVPAVYALPTLKCASASGDFQLKGYDPHGSDSYSIEIQKARHTLKYKSAANSKSNEVLVTKDIDRKVFTIAVSNRDNHTSGIFYAVPDSFTVKSNGDHTRQATYTAMYYGTDPDSQTTPKAYLQEPVQLQCEQSWQE